jgi:hypothetical protein
MHLAQIDEGQPSRDVDQSEIGVAMFPNGGREFGWRAGGGGFQAGSGENMFESTQENWLLAYKKDF